MRVVGSRTSSETGRQACVPTGLERATEASGFVSHVKAMDDRTDQVSGLDLGGQEGRRVSPGHQPQVNESTAHRTSIVKAFAASQLQQRASGTLTLQWEIIGAYVEFRFRRSTAHLHGRFWGRRGPKDECFVEVRPQLVVGQSIPSHARLGRSRWDRGNAG